jgi:hypothetical protein
MRRLNHPWRAWYSTKEWQQIRAKQLRIEPNCRICAEAGVRTPADIVDHITRHRGDRALFFGGPFQSLCKACHDRTKQQAEKLGYSTKIGPDGLPSDPRHPFNR